MIEDVQKLVKGYTNWLNDKTAIREVNGDWVEITTPYLDRHNDALQIYVRRENGHFLLSDGSEILTDLELSGCAVDTPKRRALLQEVLNGFGVKKTNDDSLIVQASAEDFPIRKHSLIQAMLSVNDLFYLAEPHTRSLFFEDVTVWLDSNDVRYVSHAKFAGKSGFDHQFDFVIPKSRKAPDRFIDAITLPNRAKAQELAFKATDTAQARPTESVAYAILNDTEKESADNVRLALTNYGVHPIDWSKRDTFIEELTA